MRELDKLQTVLLDLNKNQMKFSAQMVEFETLQSQISQLEKRALTDPDAARKWHSVNNYMSREGLQAQHQILAHVGAFESGLAKAREQLGGLSVVEPERVDAIATVSPVQIAKKHNRNFV
ncbi:hypothetical protein [Pseudomonas zeae]|uniref:hypothetical protein n=1 Tax=Pseudomonas zeae TaxID=2745510 RepID=UPI0039DF9F4A